VSLLAYALGLTNVDPLIFGTHFERFLRPNKTTLPDVDMDFESARRQEIIDYLLTKYEGRAAPISTFGYYKVKNLANDLGKCLGVPANHLATLKAELEGMISDEDAYHLDDKEEVYQYLLTHPELRKIDRLYSQVLKHFSRLFGQVRYIGKHAAGVAITEGPIENYTALIYTKDGMQTAYDLNDLGKINVVKVDILGLITVDVVKEVERQLGFGYDIYDILSDKKSYLAFTEGRTGGVFQFESRLAREVCLKVKPKNMMELVACNALNRPGPIKMGLLDDYVEGKKGKANVSALLYEHMQDSYGTLIYQEHVMNIARWAGLEWAEVDKLIKGISKKTAGKDPLRDKFIDGAVARGMAEEEAAKLYDSVSSYLFNKGHGVGYSLLSFYTMYLKQYHALEFWAAMLKFEMKEEKRLAYEWEAVTQEGIGMVTPHINGGADYGIVIDEDGDRWLRRGLATIPGVGPKAAAAIEEAGPYADVVDLAAKVPKRILKKTVLAALEEAGALEMDRAKQLAQSVAYCERIPTYLREARRKEREKLTKARKKALP
jgi:DNA polymerase-3 subunit alpha